LINLNVPHAVVSTAACGILAELAKIFPKIRAECIDEAELFSYNLIIPNNHC